jgi:AcrR family transcriptional regulator
LFTCHDGYGPARCQQPFTWEPDKAMIGKRNPKPRPRDAARTRELILQAARRSFATRGYAQSGMREIAAAAGITPALVVRYFGSKQKLFVAAVCEELGIEAFIAGDRATLGRHVVEHLVNKPPPEADSLAILLLAATDPTVSAAVRRLTHERMMTPLVQWLGGAHAESRAAQLLAIVSGAWIYRHLLPVAPLAGEPDRVTMASLAGIIQQLIDGKR